LIVNTCLSSEDRARETCAMVRRWRFFCAQYWSNAARHSSIGRQPNFGALNRGRHLLTYIRQGGHHVGHWRTFLVLLFSSSNFSGRRLEVYHTCTHSVALVQILNAGLKCAARDSLEIHNAKMSRNNRHLRTITQICRAISSQLGMYLQSGKKLVKQQYLFQISRCWRFFASCISSEPSEAYFRSAFYIHTRATPCVEVW